MQVWDLMDAQKEGAGFPDLLRVQSGIPGLDEMIEGGFPFPSTTLVAGAAGTGKTTFSLMFLMEGARRGEKGLFLTTLSESTQWMLRFAAPFKFLDRSHIGKSIEYVELGPLLREDGASRKVLDLIDEKISECAPQRIVIDPLSVVEHILGDDYRRFLFELTNRLKNWQAVSILTGEVMPDEPYPVQISYIVDTVILMNYVTTAEAGRRKYLEILKMRGTNHLTGKHLLDVSRNGLSVQAGLR
jgi:circadian clock protein KaiC